MDVQSGTYLTSLQVLEKIEDLNGFGYIAHINSSNIFKEKYLTHAYKEKLFNSKLLNVIGIHEEIHEIPMRERINKFTDKELCFVLDSDCHEIDTIKQKFFWIKGQSCNFNMIRNAIRDYNIAVQFNEPSSPSSYIKGIAVEPGNKGFLFDKNSENNSSRAWETSEKVQYFINCINMVMTEC